MVDSYHDRRTGYEFGVTAAGGRYDAAIYDDGDEDSAWDAVWDVAARIDSLGWTAEFRIPLSQIRYGSQREHTFGFAINRDLYRYNERISWPLFRRSAAGLVSQFAEVSGFDDLEAPRRLEAAPYVVAKSDWRDPGTGVAREQGLSLGADLKYRVASNLTLDATVNPDFGQVEADPAVLNLTAYETFFPEKRPFFVAGRGLFQVPINCNIVNCGGDRLFYSRRIGRAPTLAGTYDDPTSPASTTIIGAGQAHRASRGRPSGSACSMRSRRRKTGVERPDHRAGHQLRRGPARPGLQPGRRRHRSRGHHGQSAPRRVEHAVPAERVVRGGGDLPPEFFEPDLRGFGAAGREPRGRATPGDRRDPAEPRALLPATGRRPAVRPDAHGPERRRRGGEVREGGGAPPAVRDLLAAPLAGLRDQRPRLSPARGQPQLVHLGRLLRPPPAHALPQLPVELELVADLDHRGPAARARGQHEPARHPAEQLEASTPARPWANSAPPTTTARHAAAPRCGRIRTSPPGSPSTATTGAGSSRSCRPTSVRGGAGHRRRVGVEPGLGLKLSSRFTAGAVVRVVLERQRLPVVGQRDRLAGRDVHYGFARLEQTTDRDHRAARLHDLARP